MLTLLHALRQKMAIGYVGGSDLAKQQEQLGTSSIPVTTLFDFCFAENGLTAYRMGQRLASQSFIGWLGHAFYARPGNERDHAKMDPARRHNRMNGRIGAQAREDGAAAVSRTPG